MPLAYRIAAGFSILLAVMVTLGVYHLNLFHRQSTDVFRISNTSGPALQLTLGIREGLVQLTDLTAKFPAYEALEDLEEVRADGSPVQEEIRSARESIRQSIRQQIQALRTLKLLSEEERKAVDTLAQLWENHLDWEELRELRGTPDLAESPPGSRVKPSLVPVERALNELQSVSRTTLQQQTTAILHGTRRAELAARLAAVIALASAVVGSVIVGRSVLRPVRRIARGARALAEGDFTYRVPESGGQEMVALARDFNTMAARISQLDQLKKDLVSNVSHDLKAPLASMQETTRLLLEELPGPLTAQQLRLLNLNLSSGERLSRMISDLLDLSRLEAGVEDRAFEKVNLGSLLRDTVEELENLLKEREQTFRLELPRRLVEIEGRPTSLAQVLTNLLSNALKFSPRAGTLGARIQGFEAMDKAWWCRLGENLQGAVDSHGSAGALVEIWDSGPGVPEEHKERIFRRFHRVDTHRKGAQGTGLGLAIAAAIVAQHKGALWVEDRPEGGSCFRLLLWRRVPPTEEEPDPFH